jgi:hypothetical protein
MHRVEDHLHHNCATRQTLAAVTGDTVDGTALGSLAPVKVTGGNPHITVSSVSGKTSRCPARHNRRVSSPVGGAVRSAARS